MSESCVEVRNLTQPDDKGNWTCILCGNRISSGRPGQSSRPCRDVGGRAHVTCLMGRKRKRTRQSEQPNLPNENQSNNQSVNQVNDESANQVNSQSANQVNNQSLNQVNDTSENQWNNQSANQVKNQSANQVNNQSVNRTFTYQLKRDVLRSIDPSLEPLACSSLKPLNQLGATEANKRRKKYRTVDNFVRSRLDVEKPVVKIDKQAALRMNASERRSFRNACFDGVHLPCERTLNNWRKVLGVDKDTRTSVFTIEIGTETGVRKLHGAYVADPIHLVNSLSRDGDYIAVSGDYGRRHTKLGVSSLVVGVQRFVPLVVYHGKDEFSDVSRLTEPVFQFEGRSSTFRHILQVLQLFVTSYDAFLQGDLKFIYMVVGLMAPGNCNYPCFSCMSHKRDLQDVGAPRLASDSRGRKYFQPVISIAPEKIIPAPLHIRCDYIGAMRDNVEHGRGIKYFHQPIDRLFVGSMVNGQISVGVLEDGNGTRLVAPYGFDEHMNPIREAMI